MSFALPRRAGVPCAAALLAAALLAAGARAQAGTAGGVGRFLHPDALCADAHVVGQCLCAGAPCGLRVEQFVPVAFVETTRRPGDSLLAGALANLLSPTVAGTASSSLSDTDNTAEAHVWSLPAGPLPGVPCLGCAPLPVPAGVAAVAAAAARVGMPTLVYASEVDAFNWRTGCRDLADPAIQVAALQWRCAAAAAAGFDAGAAPPYCLGRWGLMVPRQMRDIGPTPPLYSAKTAMRAMSIAREQLGTLPYPVDAAGKLQQVYPAPSACFRVGQLPLPQAPDSPRPVVRSTDGRYAWLYWRRSSCCMGPGALHECLRPR